MWNYVYIFSLYIYFCNLTFYCSMFKTESITTVISSIFIIKHVKTHHPSRKKIIMEINQNQDDFKGLYPLFYDARNDPKFHHHCLISPMPLIIFLGQGLWGISSCAVENMWFIIVNVQSVNKIQEHIIKSKKKCL